MCAEIIHYEDYFFDIKIHDIEMIFCFLLYQEQHDAMGTRMMCLIE